MLSDMSCDVFPQDETGASAILAEQLDASLGGKPKESRELQGSESPEFQQVLSAGLLSDSPHLTHPG